MKKARNAVILLLVLLVGMLAGCQKQTEAKLETGVNLLANSSLSQLTDGLPDGWQTSAYVPDDWCTLYSVEEEGGERILRIENIGSNDARFTQTLLVDPDSFYRFSGRIRASGIESGAGANLSFEDTFVNTEPLYDTGGEWVDVEIYAQTGADQTELTLYVRLGGYGGESTGVAEFTGLSFEKLDALPEGVEAYSVVPQSSQADDSQDNSRTQYLGLIVLITAAYVIALFYLGGRMLPEKAPLSAREEQGVVRRAWWIVLLTALGVRILLAMLIQGYPNDIACWMGWSGRLADEGPWNFYTSGEFADYPPGYMLVLWLIGGIRNLLGLPYGHPLFLLLVKLPAIGSDLVIAWLLAKLARREGWGQEAGILAAAAWLFNPAVLIDSSAWGQIDAFFTLIALGYLWMLYRKKIPWASLLLVVGTLVKPQMLMLAPALPAVWILRIREDGIKAALVDVAVSLGLGLAALVVIAAPFTPGQSWDWIFHKYIDTIGSYPYASVNAANLMTLLGGLWVEDTTVVAGISYKTLGWIGIALSLAYFFFLVLRDRDRRNLFLYTAVMLSGIYTFGVNMHERYMFPVLVLLLVAYILTKRRSTLWLLLSSSVVQSLNIGLVLANQYLPPSGWVLTLLSVLSVINGVLILVEGGLVAFGMPDKVGFPKLEDSEDRQHRIVVREEPAAEPGEIQPRGVGMTKKDWLWAGIITVVYAAVALVYLGSTSAPQTDWIAQTPGESVVLDLGEGHAPVHELMIYRGLANDGATLTISISADGSSWEELQSVVLDESDGGGDVFKWHSYDTYIEARYIRLTMTIPAMRIGEIVLREEIGDTLTIQSVAGDTLEREDGPANAFDEQDTVPEYPGFYSGTYFDEIYHARTAWEHVEGITDVYEWTHPPLGKIIIGIGIRLFGMTPFGWRIMGTVFGILMLPLMYMLGKAVFRRSRYAVIATLLMALDFMHFTQTRIATIDVYAVFWIMGMYYFMLRYVLLDHSRAPLGKQLLWLGLSGLFFGLGAASKWTCLYAGAGLAVMFFWTMIRRICQGRRAARDIPEEARRAMRKEGLRKLAITGLWCVLVFLCIPAVIYCLSYMPYMPGGKFDLQVVIDNQIRMYNYHSTLVDDHFFKSPWYQWPVIWKPMWYYKNDSLPAGWMGSIAAFGNPAVWWMGTAAMIYLAVRIIRQKSMSKTSWFILLGFLAQYLPWVLVPRSMFIYHYFTATPFFILAIVVMISRWERNPAHRKWTYLYLGIAALLFVAFYPVLSGMPIPSAYGKLLRWLPTWYFTY